MFLFCIVRGLRCKAAAPTGIAAANIEIPRTDVRASTLHALFEFDNEYKTKLDFTKQLQSVVELLHLNVLLLDEVSMIDDACFSGTGSSEKNARVIETNLSLFESPHTPDFNVSCFRVLDLVFAMC